jgi:uncharacterized membrane protein YidH (DUF202 family)
MSDEAAVADAEQRTDLAWVRSALTFCGVGVAILKGFKPIGAARPVEGLVAIGLGAAVALLSAAYLRRRRHADAPVGRTLFLMSAGTMAIGLVAIVVGASR